MPGSNFEKQAQDYYNKAPLIILGSGASSAHGMSGMWALAKHLVANTNTSGLSAGEVDAWGNFCQVLDSGVDLESALHQVAVTEELTARIIRSTWSLINTEDLHLFTASLLNQAMFPLSRLLSHMVKSSLTKINIVTTN